MGVYSLATRYAKSLIGLAREKGSLEDAFADIKYLQASFESNKDLKLMFKSPLIPTDKKLAIAKLVFESKLHNMVYSFVVLIIKKGREAYLDEIANAFLEQYNAFKNITPVKLTSAVKLEAEQVNKIISSLKSREKLGEVELEEVINPELIGGFILEYNGKMIDSSVSRGLHTLKNIIEDDSYIKKYV